MTRTHTHADAATVGGGEQETEQEFFTDCFSSLYARALASLRRWYKPLQCNDPSTYPYAPVVSTAAGTDSSTVVVLRIYSSRL
eukprot:3668651-Rhodomonas_salina.1